MSEPEPRDPHHDALLVGLAGIGLAAAPWAEVLEGTPSNLAFLLMLIGLPCGIALVVDDMSDARAARRGKPKEPWTRRRVLGLLGVVAIAASIVGAWLLLSPHVEELVPPRTVDAAPGFAALFMSIAVIGATIGRIIDLLGMSPAYERPIDLVQVPERPDPGDDETP